VRTGAVAIRVGLVAVAVAAMVWLALGLRASRLEERGIALATSSRANPAVVAEARRALIDAQENNADTHPLFLLGQLYIFTRRPDLAIAPLEEVVRREPENHDAWAALTLAAEASGNRPLAQRARARTLALAPPVPTQ
jgi:predicted Zn-dependent protease